MLRYDNCHDRAERPWRLTENVVDGSKKETGVVAALPMK